MQTLKSLLVTMIILGGAFLAYDYYLAPDADKMVFKRLATANPATAAPADAPPAANTEPRPADAAVPAPPVPVAPAAPPSPAPAPAPSPAPPQVTDGFVPPAIPSVELATANWTRIPLTAFPRIAKLTKAIMFKANFGSTQVAAGSEVTVLAAQDRMLTVAPNAQSPLRATVELEATDLQETLTKLYEAWRLKRIAAARYAWEHRNDAAPAPVVAAPTVDADGKPQMGTDGAYPLLLASMKAGQVTEVTPHNITKWGHAEQGDFKGKKCWNVPVDFDAVTAFGTFPTVAMAKVVDGNVAGWFYRDSGEAIP
jgi:hypothetical protein